mmetsp:Transcript_128470/g.411816  ORF Transcript_128470/g.411816 Transcript_128470/m.411816 type:complete len:102 (+) Transcript_128470:39-344(+)
MHPDSELLAGLAKANQLQQLWLQSCETCVTHGCTGSDMLKTIHARMAAIGWVAGDELCGKGGKPQCDGAIFSHPIGDFMHSAGPYIKDGGPDGLPYSDCAR